jgi:acyl-CoA synthetase (AMP-forming)/AMP-acid ligase II
VALLRQAAAERPDGLYLDLLDERNAPHERSFGAVWAGAQGAARGLRARGVRRGDRLALLLPTGDDFLHAFFGALVAGAVPVPLPFPLTLGDPAALVLGLAPIVASAAPALLVTLPHLADAAAGLVAGDPGRVVLPAAIAAAAAAAPGDDFPEPDGADLALLQYASGPVLAPTGVTLTHRHILASVFGLGTALRLTERDVALTWAPLVQDMGLIGGLLTSLYWRCPLHVMPPQSFLMHPDRWLKNIARFRVTLASAPNAGYQLCVRRVQDRHLDGVDLSSWRVALNGAETVRPATVEAFRARFAGAGFDPRAVVPSYGIAENTLATACPDLDDLADPYHVATFDGGAPVVALGQPLAGQELAIMDARGAIVAAGAAGEVVVRGPCVMAGYHGDVAATRRAIDAAGWLHTGDRGVIADGRLYLTGRLKDMVIKVGRNFYPADVEGVLAAAAPAGRVLAFACPNAAAGTEDLVLLVEGVGPDAAAERALNAALLARLGLRADRIVPVAPGALAGPRDRAHREELIGRYGDLAAGRTT